MEPSLKELVRVRAGNACEYCRLPQDATSLISFHIEHIVARQHGGSDAPDALALACDRCNAYKGPNLTSIDPDTNSLAPLFNPRTDAWGEHFGSQWIHRSCNAEGSSYGSSAQYERSTTCGIAKGVAGITLTLLRPGTN